MSRELFKYTFLPLDVDDLSDYERFLNEDRHWRVLYDKDVRYALDGDDVEIKMEDN